jgi:hypothetical protein
MEPSIQESKDIEELTTYLNDKLSISRCQGTEGFSSILSKGLYITGEFNDKSQIDIMFSNFLSTESFNTISTSQKQELEFTFKIFSSQHVTFTSRLDSRSFVISYQNGKGNMSIYFIKISPFNTVSQTFTYTICLMITDFIPTNPYIIITEHNSSWFKKSNIQRIHYLPKSISSAHTNAIIHISETFINTLKKMNC